MLRRFVIVALVIFCLYPAAFAANLGHYSPDSNGVRDYVMPSEKGLSLSSSNTYYDSNSFQGPGGNKFDSLTTTGTVTKYITIGGNPTPVTLTGNGTINLDFKLNNFTQSFDLTWEPDVKFLGADYSLVISPSWGYARTQAKVTADANCSVTVGSTTKQLVANSTNDFMEQNTGFGDLYVQPVWLAWRGRHYDIGLSYGFYAPTGYYDKDSLANIGYGFWTQQLQANLCYYPFTSKATALILRPTYEWNSKKIDENLTPGQTMTVEYGFSQYFHPRLEVAILGYTQLELTGERGSDSTNKKPLSYTSGVGGLVNWWLIEKKFSLTAKFNTEYGTRFNFQGNSWSLNGVWIF